MTEPDSVNRSVGEEMGRAALVAVAATVAALGAQFALVYLLHKAEKRIEKNKVQKTLTK